MINVLSLFDGRYDIYSNGKIFSNIGKRKEIKGHILHGYRQVLLTHNGKRVYKFVHRLVAESFIPKTNDNLEVNHKDGNKLNNDAKNLEWVTSKENKIHARNMGLLHHKATTEMISKIMELSPNNSIREISKTVGLGRTQVNNIILGRSWN